MAASVPTTSLSAGAESGPARRTTGGDAGRSTHGGGAERKAGGCARERGNRAKENRPWGYVCQFGAKVYGAVLGVEIYGADLGCHVDAMRAATVAR